jgi:hypothetical protein
LTNFVRSWDNDLPQEKDENLSLPLLRASVVFAALFSLLDQKSVNA